MGEDKPHGFTPTLQRSMPPSYRQLRLCVPAHVFQHCVPKELQLLIVLKSLRLFHLTAVHLHRPDQILHPLVGDSSAGARQELRVSEGTVGEGVADVVCGDREG